MKRKNNLSFDKKAYDKIYINKKFSRFSYNAIFSIDKNIYIFLFGVLTSYSINLFVLLKDVSFSEWCDFIVLGVGIGCSIIGALLSINFVIMVINLQEASQAKLLQDNIINKTLSATNRNLINFNCLINYIVEVDKPLEELSQEEVSKLLIKLSRIKARLISILMLVGVSLLAIIIMLILNNI